MTKVIKLAHLKKERKHSGQCPCSVNPSILLLCFPVSLLFWSIYSSLFKSIHLSIHWQEYTANTRATTSSSLSSVPSGPGLCLPYPPALPSSTFSQQDLTFRHCTEQHRPHSSGAKVMWRESQGAQLHPTSLMFQAPSGFPQGSLRVPSFLFRTCCTSLRTCYTNLSFPMSSLEPVTDCHSAFYQDAKPEALSRLFWIVSSFWASWNKFSKGWTCERALKSISPFHSTSPRDKRQAFLKIYPYAAKKISQACRQFMHTAIKVYRNPVAPEGKYAFEAAWLQSAGP
jgi:hypothetical protein